MIARYLSSARGRAQFLLTSTLAVLAAGCGSDGHDLDGKLDTVIARQGLTGDPAAGRIVADISEPLPQLGKLLFFTRALGGDMDSACVSCHHPALGGADALPLSIGVGAEIPELLGPGRVHAATAHGYDGGPTVPRNAPTTFNVVLADQVLFDDGRVESLGKTPAANGADGNGIRTPDSVYGTSDPGAMVDLPHAQARFPVTSPEEMRGFNFVAEVDNEALRKRLAERIGDYGAGTGELPRNFWLTEFQVAFDSSAPAETLITYDNIAQAISAYEVSQLFVDNAWSRYVNGDKSALSGQAKRGALLFFEEPDAGGAGCARCHSGDAFTDESFHVLAIPQIGRGKGDGLTGDNDFGRYRETGDENDRFAFRTPSLLNTSVTGPYGHSGAYASLADVVRHHLDAESSASSFDYGQLDPGIQTASAVENTAAAIEQLRALRAQNLSLLPELTLNNEQITDLVAFLQALTDPCVTDKACLAPWIPGLNDADPDGLRVLAIGATGEPL